MNHLPDASDANNTHGINLADILGQQTLPDNYFLYDEWSPQSLQMHDLSHSTMKAPILVSQAVKSVGVN